MKIDTKIYIVHEECASSSTVRKRDQVLIKEKCQIRQIIEASMGLEGLYNTSLNPRLIIVNNIKFEYLSPTKACCP